MDEFIYVIISIVYFIIFIIFILVFTFGKKVKSSLAHYFGNQSISTPSESVISEEDIDNIQISTIYLTIIQCEMDDELPDYYEIMIEELPSYREVMDNYRYDNNLAVNR
ncbi:hypothetical protein PVAND_005373 [Polypedilum vanderplanki]|uniref:Uncharacterized protein n=1 Tax=Polypedilum vanderplanki TaxID=319348 RepID=A0A9J6C0N8_POLVA|nr:hypothetical protein PVAND_005373 [Polypedilum vanderplanki]